MATNRQAGQASERERANPGRNNQQWGLVQFYLHGIYDYDMVCRASGVGLDFDSCGLTWTSTLGCPNLSPGGLSFLWNPLLQLSLKLITSRTHGRPAACHTRRPAPTQSSSFRPTTLGIHVQLICLCGRRSSTGRIYNGHPQWGGRIWQLPPVGFPARPSFDFYRNPLAKSMA